MSNVLPFSAAPPPRPQAAAPAAPSPASALLPATGGRRGTYAIGDLARELRLPPGRSVRGVIDTLRQLARTSGMPLPRTPRIVGARELRGPAAICKASLWDAGEVDAWLDGRGPAAPAAPVPPAIRADLAARAARIATLPARAVA